MPKKKRPIVAFLINEIEGDYHESLMSGVYNAAQALDVNLVVAVGKSLNSTDSYEHNFNLAYYFLNNNNVDGVIISSGAMSKFTDEQHLKEFIKRFTVPVVSISIPIGSSCCIDNKTGLAAVIEHLITVHNKKKIAFIRGPEDHNEANERFQVYVDTLKTHNLPLNPDLIIKGNFTYMSAYNAVQAYLDKKLTCDALVCSNDEMAFGAISALKEKNIRIPEDLAVTGFDNISTSLLSRLTTVSQPTYDVGYNAMELLVQAITKKKYESKILTTELVIRDSCGCTLENIMKQNAISTSFVKIESFIDDFVKLVSNEINAMFELDEFKSFLHILLDYLLNPTNPTTLFELFNQITAKLTEDNCYLLFNIIIKIRNTIFLLDINSKAAERCFFDLTTILIEQLNQKSSIRKRRVLNSVNNLRRILIRMLSTLDDLNEQKTYLFEKFKDLGINNFSIYLYEKNFKVNDTELIDFVKADNLKLFLSTRNAQYSLKNTDLLISDLFYTARSTYILFPLFFKDEQLGLALYEYRNILYDNSVFETLTVELSSVLKISQLLSQRDQIEHKLQITLQELEKYNRELNQLSTSDELTGLYNRRGFFNLAQKSLELAQKTENDGCLFFVDIDGLKDINDTYGHKAGDLAISDLAHILKKAFRSSDIIARLGGDEFTILSVTSALFYEKLIFERLKDLIDAHNKVSGKPYKLSISIGCVSFKKDEQDITIDVLMKKADSFLYAEKNKKKNHKHKTSVNRYSNGSIPNKEESL